MKQSLIKTATIVTGMGGELVVSFLENNTAKVTISIPGTEKIELMSGASLKKIERTASTLLSRVNGFKKNKELTDDEIIQTAFTTNA